MPTSPVANALAGIVQNAAGTLQHAFLGVTGNVEEVDEHATGADIASEKVIVAALFRRFPEIPILMEEQQEEIVAQLRCECKGVKLILAHETDAGLPDTYFSVDPMDGSALFVNGCEEFAVSVGLIEDGKPVVGAVAVPLWQFTIVAERGKGCWISRRFHEPFKCVELHQMKPLHRSMIGLDNCKSVSPEENGIIIAPLTKACRYPRNLPSVASGIELLLGRTAAWVSTTSKNWDVAATSLMIEEAGGTAMLLDGTPLRWDAVKPPPVLFAVNHVIAKEVRQIVSAARDLRS